MLQYVCFARTGLSDILPHHRRIGLGSMRQRQRPYIVHNTLCAYWRIQIETVVRSLVFLVFTHVRSTTSFFFDTPTSQHSCFSIQYFVRNGKKKIMERVLVFFLVSCVCGKMMKLPITTNSRKPRMGYNSIVTVELGS